MSTEHSQLIEMQRLATKLIDRVATETDEAALSSLLQSNPHLHDAFVHLMQNEAALDELHANDLSALGIDPACIDREKPSPTGSAAAHRPNIALGPEAKKRGAAKAVKRNATDWSRFSSLSALIGSNSGWALAASLAVLACGYLLWPSSYATVVATENVEWRDGTHFEVGERLGGEWIGVEEGVVQLAYSSSAVMKIEGPAEFRVNGDRNCELRLGSVLAYVPPDAHGFTVDTPKMLVVDRGTSFRVDVSAENDASLQVLEGMVDAEAKSSGKSHRLVAGEVAAIRGSGQQSELQISTEEQLFPQTSNRIAFRAKHVRSLGHAGFKGNNRCYVFMERYDFALPHDTTVNLSESGRHAEFDGESGSVGEGTRVDCFLVHSAPRGKRHVVEGTITFDKEILGVIASSDKLNATNSMFGSPWLLRCQHPERGFEGTPNRNSDRVEISSDRHTLKIAVRTESIDQLRVLVQTTAK